MKITNEAVVKIVARVCATFEDNVEKQKTTSILYVRVESSYESVRYFV